LRAAVVDGEVYDAAGAVELSKLPSLDEMRAKMLNLFTTPASMLVRMVAAPSTQLAQVVKARAEKLESQG
jgi:large subunit ribosomal protein L10